MLIGRHRAGVRAVDGVDLQVRSGEILGWSAKAAAESPPGQNPARRGKRESAGDIILDVAAGGLAPIEARRVRSDIQYVLHDPARARSLVVDRPFAGRGPEDPAATARRPTARRAGAPRARRGRLDPATAGRYPQEPSGASCGASVLPASWCSSRGCVILDEPTAGSRSVGAGGGAALRRVICRYRLGSHSISSSADDPFGRAPASDRVAIIVSRPHRRDRTDRRGLQHAAPSLHPRPAGGLAAARQRARAERAGAGRAAQGQAPSRRAAVRSIRAARQPSRNAR